MSPGFFNNEYLYIHTCAAFCLHFLVFDLRGPRDFGSFWFVRSFSVFEMKNALQFSYEGMYAGCVLPKREIEAVCLKVTFDNVCEKKSGLIFFLSSHGLSPGP